jgi:hypothetical protein
VRGPLFLPELRYLPPAGTPLMITSQHSPRIVIQTPKTILERPWFATWPSRSFTLMASMKTIAWLSVAADGCEPYNTAAANICCILLADPAERGPIVCRYSSRPQGSLPERACVDGQRYTCDEASFIGSEEQDCIGNIDRLHPRNRESVDNGKTGCCGLLAGIRIRRVK